MAYIIKRYINTKGETTELTEHNYQAAVGIKMGSGACESGNLRSSVLTLFELLKSSPKLSNFSVLEVSFFALASPSGGFVTMGALSLVVSKLCLWNIPIAIFASLGILFKSGLFSAAPMCLYISSGSTRNLYM